MTIFEANLTAIELSTNEFDPALEVRHGSERGGSAKEARKHAVPLSLD